MAGNVVLYRDNAVLFKDNAVLFGADGDPCCCGGVPCGTDCSGMASAYTVAGHAGITASCPSCSTTTNAQWDGVVNNGSVPGNCNFSVLPAGGCGSVQIGSGYSFGGATLTLSSFDGGITCVWVLEIDCCGLFFNGPIWIGKKAAGGTPAGTYDFDASLSPTVCGTGPATLTVS